MPHGVQGSRIQLSNKALVDRDGGRGGSQHSVLLMPDPSAPDPQGDMLVCITAFADVFGVSRGLRNNPLFVSLGKVIDGDAS
jgi:hypothetical protein